MAREFIVYGQWRWPEGQTDAFYQVYEDDPKTAGAVAKAIKDALSSKGALEMFWKEKAVLEVGIAARDPDHPIEEVREEVAERTAT